MTLPSGRPDFQGESSHNFYFTDDGFFKWSDSRLFDSEQLFYFGANHPSAGYEDFYGMPGAPYHSPYHEPGGEGDYFGGYSSDWDHGAYCGYGLSSPYAAPVSEGLVPTSPQASGWSRPLRVAYAGMAFQVGGVEQHLLSLVKFWDRRRVRFEQYLCTVPGSINVRHAARAPFPVVATDARGLWRAAHEYDVLMLWGQGFNGWLPPQRRCATVFVAHGESQWCRDTLVHSSRAVDHVIAISARVRERVCQGFPTTLIHNGVDAARLAQTRSRDAVRERLGFAPGDFVLGSVGRFSKEKQTARLIEAAGRLPRDFKLLLVGWGSQRPKLLDLANELIPCRYAFISADDYLGDYYQAMDAFCLMSEHEGFSLALAEAMLCGLPVIATNVGIVPEVLQHRVNGLVFDGSVAGLADSARTLRAHPVWAKGLATEAQAVAQQRFHAARMARDYEHLFARLCQARNQQRGKPAT